MFRRWLWPTAAHGSVLRSRGVRHRASRSSDSHFFYAHLDGFNQLEYLTGEAEESARRYFFYTSDDGDLTAMRMDNWKFVFMEIRAPGTLQVWAEPFTELRVPKVFNLRTDPYERADFTSNTYWDWLIDHAFLVVPAQAFVMQMAATLHEFPPRQESSSFTVGKMLEKLKAGLPST